MFTNSESFSRRCFLRRCAGFGAFACLPALGDRLSKGSVRLRLGVVSDIHVREGDESCDTTVFRRALAYVRDQGVDAVMIAGDMSDWGKISDLQLVADAWYDVFPDDKLPDGRHVEKLFVYGNHDLNGEGRSDLHANMIAQSEASKAAAWERCFKEKYETIWLKDVKGYKIVGAHWGYEKRADLAAFLRAHAAELKGPQPFFFVQHAHPKGTCMGDWAWGHDDGASTAALSTFPNAVAFTGHSHYSLTDERSVWQGAFTSVNTSSLRFTGNEYNLCDNTPGNSFGFRGWPRSGATPMMDRLSFGSQGQIVEVYDHALVLKRLEFTTFRSLGDDWVVPWPKDGSFAFAPRAAKRVAPAFAPADKLRVVSRHDDKSGDCLDVFIPAARAVDGCRPFSYEVTATLLADDTDLVIAQKRVLANGFNAPLSEATGETQCSFKVAELPKGASIRFDVRPIECFGKKGGAISVLASSGEI